MYLKLSPSHPRTPPESNGTLGGESARQRVPPSSRWLPARPRRAGPGQTRSPPCNSHCPGSTPRTVKGSASAVQKHGPVFTQSRLRRGALGPSTPVSLLTACLEVVVGKKRTEAFREGLVLRSQREAFAPRDNSAEQSTWGPPALHAPTGPTASLPRARPAAAKRASRDRSPARRSS